MPLLAMLLAADDVAALVATAHARTAVEARCVPSDTTDVTVCGRRGADRFRVPFTEYRPGSAAHDSARAERTALLHRTNPVQDMGPFQVGGGMAGVSAGVAFGGPGAGHVAAEGLRPLAP